MTQPSGLTYGAVVKSTFPGSAPIGAQIQRVALKVTPASTTPDTVSDVLTVIE